MAKQKKKRNKTYTGADASSKRPTVTRISAANRNGISQWWYDNKRIAKPAIIATAAVTVILWLLIEIIRIISGNIA